MSVCQGCGASLPPSKGPRPRKWCSGRCRKAQYGGRCVDCGAPTYGGNGPTAAPLRCAACGIPRGAAISAAAKHEAARERHEEFMALYRAGVSYADIAAHFGVTKGRVAVWANRLRGYGYDLPYRYRMENGRRVAA